MEYTSAMARNAYREYRESLKPNNINVANFIKGTDYFDDDEKAKRYIKKFAKERNLKIKEIFEEYEDDIEHSIRALSMDGYFDV